MTAATSALITRPYAKMMQARCGDVSEFFDILTCPFSKHDRPMPPLIARDADMRNRQNRSDVRFLLKKRNPQLPLSQAPLPAYVPP
eukprot:10657129-Heterocapsa_arctica.AAC.1